MNEIKVSSRLKTFGTIVYASLVVSAAFLDIPILGLLAVLVFVVTIPICITLLFSLPEDKASNKRWLSAFLIPIGVIGLSITMGYAAIQYSGYLVASSRNVIERFYPPPWEIILTVMIANVVATSVVTLGIKQRSGWKDRKLFLLWFVLFLAVPLVVATVKLLEILGVPFCT